MIRATHEMPRMAVMSDALGLTGYTIEFRSSPAEPPLFPGDWKPHTMSTLVHLRFDGAGASVTLESDPPPLVVCGRTRFKWLQPRTWILSVRSRAWQRRANDGSMDAWSCRLVGAAMRQLALKDAEGER